MNLLGYSYPILEAYGVVQLIKDNSRLTLSENLWYVLRGDPVSLLSEEHLVDYRLTDDTCTSRPDTEPSFSEQFGPRSLSLGGLRIPFFFPVTVSFGCDLSFELKYGYSVRRMERNAKEYPQVIGMATPQARATLRGELTVGFLFASLTLDANVVVLDIETPYSFGANLHTMKSCDSLDINTNAFGGNIILSYSVFLLGEGSYVIYDWNGYAYNTILAESSCCSYCPNSCNRGECWLGNGTCSCDKGWSGDSCDIGTSWWSLTVECPSCSAVSHPIQCTQSSGGPTCSCRYGYFGLNCEKGIAVL